VLIRARDLSIVLTLGRDLGAKGSRFLVVMDEFHRCRQSGKSVGQHTVAVLGGVLVHESGPR
jgi:hypothetical protein